MSNLLRCVSSTKKDRINFLEGWVHKLCRLKKIEVASDTTDDLCNVIYTMFEILTDCLLTNNASVIEFFYLLLNYDAI